jgi:hypothetical protein
MEIGDAIRKAPPLQREDLAKHYVGLYVEWDTWLDNATRVGEKVNLSVRPGEGVGDKGFLTSIRCRVSLSEYRELALIKEGTHIRLSGKIAKAEQWAIELADAELKIIEKE